MRFPIVLFDLDGTLIDSGAMILASFRHATQTVLEREIPDEELLAAVGGSGLVEQMRTIDPARVDELVESYREHNEPLHDELQACAGVLDLLRELKDEGRRLGVVSAKRRVTIALAFSVLPLADSFDVVVGSDETQRHKPHPDPLLLALERLGAEAPAAAYVGDSPFDVQAAKAAGIFAVAVTWGRIHSEERLERERPDALVHSPEELRAVL
ncbi:MAG: HAD-IA family hydrolase [Gaiellaceae bacterium]